MVVWGPYRQLPVHGRGPAGGVGRSRPQADDTFLKICCVVMVLRMI